jgi:hypothetical protein
VSNIDKQRIAAARKLEQLGYTFAGDWPPPAGVTAAIHLVMKMSGHYAYYGISGNIRRLRRYTYEVDRICHKWLQRRDRRRRFLWDRFRALLKRHPLPAPRIVHRYWHKA